ncbi:MAG: SLC13 family permease [Candidatus Dechloromonas phosphoritropha]|nr:anion permease [Candidatus Dechloromonas phosphoritropha]MBP8789204.1 anion permease [Azonexus sp.]
MIYFAALVVLATLIAMASGRVPAVLALATAICVAGITGLAPVPALFAGLGNGGIITVAAMLVIAKGIVHTGAVSRVTWALLSTVTSAQHALRRLALPIGVGSGLMNTTPIVAMLVPAAKELEQNRGINARELLLPIAHITTLTGSVTLIGTSSNLLIAGIAAPMGIDISMLSFAPVALPVAVVGAAIVYLIAPLMLRGQGETVTATQDFRVEIPVSGKALAIGRVAADFGIDQTQQYALNTIRRWDADVDPASPIEAGDTLVFSATESGVTALWGSPLFGLAEQRLYRVSMGSSANGTVRDFETDGGIRVIAARTTSRLRDTEVRPGKTAFVTTPRKSLLVEQPDVTLVERAASPSPQPGKTAVALAILAAVIVSASFGLVAVELASLTGAVLMVITGILTPKSAVRALDWNVLFILVGSVALGAIVVESGLATVLSDAIRHLAGGSMLLVVIVFAVTTAIVTNLVTNAAAASILTPVAIGIANEMGINPVTLLALIGTCISFTFINPFSHQSNLMVMVPGGYTSASFAKFGVPLVAGSLVTVVIVAYLLLHLQMRF